MLRHFRTLALRQRRSVALHMLNNYVILYKLPRRKNYTQIHVQRAWQRHPASDFFKKLRRDASATIAKYVFCFYLAGYCKLVLLNTLASSGFKVISARITFGFEARRQNCFDCEAMEISAAHARELEKQKQRKAALKDDCIANLEGVDRILFEAGCGHGHWLTSYAERYPEQTCVGIDLIAGRVRKALQKRDKRGLGNLHFFKAELMEFLEVLPEHVRFDATILLFPDPWPKVKHHRRRMVQTPFLDEVARRTHPGGRFCFRTDDIAYHDWTIEYLEKHPNWEIDSTAEWPHEAETYFQGMMDAYQSVIARRSDRS